MHVALKPLFQAAKAISSGSDPPRARAPLKPLQPAQAIRENFPEDFRRAVVNVAARARI
jgi:hypothetical protein